MRTWTRAGAVVLMVAVSLAGAATARARPAAAGSFYGGLTSEHNPIVVELNKSRHRVVQIAAAMDFSCSSEATFTWTERYIGLKIDKRGRFRIGYTDTQRNDDGTTTDYKGTLLAVVNKRATKVTGRWSEKATYFDNMAAVTDTCDTGSVTFTAKQ